MKKHSFSDPIDPAVMRLIESIALSFSRLHRLPLITTQDLAQELAHKYVRVRSECDPSKVRNWGWLRPVLLNTCHSIRREVMAKKRWPRRRLRSLNEDVGDGDGRIADASQNVVDPRSLDEPRRRDLRRKLKNIGKTLPAIQRLRDQVERTGRRPMPSQLKYTAKASGFRSVDEMRQFFEDEGLLDLL